MTQILLGWPTLAFKQILKRTDKAGFMHALGLDGRLDGFAFNLAPVHHSGSK